MKYILDFDGVIFNVQLLKDKMAELGIEESNRSKDTFEEIKLRDPAFDLEALIFDDAKNFIDSHEGDCEIVSSYVSTRIAHSESEDVQRAYQEKKIELAGLITSLGTAHIHVVGRSKKEMLTELKDRFVREGVDCIFIDDRKEHIEEAEALGVTSFWMNRSDTENSEPKEMHEIHSFDELESHVEKIWKK